MNPREALLRQANNNTPNKEIDYFSNVFKKNMPDRIYAKRTLEADRDEESKRKKVPSAPKESTVCLANITSFFLQLLIQTEELFRQVKNVRAAL